MGGVKLPFYSSAPAVLGSSPFPFPLRCPVKGDVAWLSSHHMSDPSPSHDDGAHAVLVAVGEKVLVGDGLGPEYSQDSSKALGMEGG